MSPSCLCGATVKAALAFYLSDCPLRFDQWVARLRQLDWQWQFPLLDQREILRGLFQECQYLENSVSF